MLLFSLPCAWECTARLPFQLSIQSCRDKFPLFFSHLKPQQWLKAMILLADSSFCYSFGVCVCVQPPCYSEWCSSTLVFCTLLSNRFTINPAYYTIWADPTHASAVTCMPAVHSGTLSLQLWWQHITPRNKILDNRAVKAASLFQPKPHLIFILRNRTHSHTVGVVGVVGENASSILPIETNLTTATLEHTAVTMATRSKAHQRLCIVTHRHCSTGNVAGKQYGEKKHARYHKQKWGVCRYQEDS